MGILVKDGGIWKDSAPMVKDGGVWKEVKEGYVKEGGVWKEIHSSGTSWVVSPTHYVLHFFPEYGGYTSDFFGAGLPVQKEFAGETFNFVGEVHGSSAPPRNTEVRGYALDSVHLKMLGQEASTLYSAAVEFSSYPGSMMGKLVEVNGTTLTCNRDNGFQVDITSNYAPEGSATWPFVIMGLPAAIPYGYAYPFPTPTPTPFRVTILDI